MNKIMNTLANFGLYWVEQELWWNERPYLSGNTHPLQCQLDIAFNIMAREAND